MNPGEICCGFKLVEERKIDEISSKGLVFIHEGSGAKLIKIENKDDNKVFSIGFRTPPKDSTGLTHILEHSVLCGSDKFPCKEPFVELLKGSMNTFLNAMTFPDKTIYPVASRNTKDFFNLMDVYMDAVLHPNIYKYKEIFEQEGWHYELDGLEGELTYNGVVYNEMKGAYSSPESVLYRKITQTLFPDTPYSQESGGDPDHIPELSYEEFIDFHKTYYHPSNSYIFLYGDGDTKEELKFLNDNYLKNYSKIDVDSKLPSQKAFDKPVEVTIPYGIAENEDNNNKAFLNANFVADTSFNEEENLAMQILEYILLETPASPLKKALIEADIGKSVYGDFDTSLKQPVFSIIAKNGNADNKEYFKEILFSTLKELVDEGIDSELIESSINKIEFSLREGDYKSYPTGLMYNMMSLDSWLHDEDPFIKLQFDKALENIKKESKNRCFENLIKKYILNNNHSSIVVLKPEKGISEKKDAELKEKLKAHKASLSKEELNAIMKASKKLKERQTTPDTEEALNSVPLLSIDDIDKKAVKLPLEERIEDDIKVLFHDIDTNKIAYMNLYFRADAVPQELVPYAKLLTTLMGKISTNYTDYSALSNKINLATGGMGISLNTYGKSDDSKEYTPMVVVKSKTLMDKMPDAAKLISEIMTETDYSDKKRVLEVIKETKAYFESLALTSGHIVSFNRSMAYFMPKGRYDEITGGLEFYHFLCDLEKNFDKNWETISNNLSKTSQYIFNKNNLLISYSSTSDEYENLKKILPELTVGLNSEEPRYIKYDFPELPGNEALLTQSNVQYVAKSGDYKKAGFKYDGSLVVLETIGGYDYLWNNVRVLGGAYGVMTNFRRDGSVFIVSYRDPNIKETIDVYDKMYEYVKDFSATEREMTKYIIGAINKVDYPFTNSMKGEAATSEYLRGITYEDIQRERDEILEITPEKIQALSPLMKDVMKQNHLCVLGNEKKLMENKDLFVKMIRVIE